MKKIIILLLAILLLPFNAFAIEENYVIVENTKLNQDVIDYINEYSSYLKKTINVRFYVFLSSEEKDEEYIKKMEQEFNTNYSGILLVGMKEIGSIQVKIGNYISNRFRQNELDDILTEYGIKNIEKNNWEDAIKKTYIMLYKQICSSYDIDTTRMKVEGEDFLEKNKVWITFLMIGIGIFLSISISSFFKRKRKKVLDYIIMTSSMVLNFLLVYVSFYYFSIIATIPILLGEFTTILLYFKDPGRIEKTKKLKKRKKHR